MERHPVPIPLPQNFKRTSGLKNLAYLKQAAPIMKALLPATCMFRARNSPMASITGRSSSISIQVLKPNHMKKNLYYTFVFKNSALDNKVVNVLLQFLELPKVIILPFMRKNMGERYFSLMPALFMAGLIYLSIPYLHKAGLANVWHLYVFDIVFVIVSALRHLQIRQGPSVFDFARF